MAFKLVIPKKNVIHPRTYSPKYLLHEHLCRDEKARPYGDVHASDLMGYEDFCPREHALGVKYNVHRGVKRVYTSESVTYAYGYAVEDLVRKWFTEISRAHGNWRCKACNQLHSFRRRPIKCKSCGMKEFDYEEQLFVSPEGVLSRPDLYIDFGRPKLTILEIKSIDKEKFKTLYAPLAEHRWRTSLYMRCIEASGHPLAEKIDTKKAFVFYVTKGGYGFKDEELPKWKLNDGDHSPFKEFEIERDDAELDEALEMAQAVETFKQTGEVPLGICPTALVPRARFCKLREKCWGGDE